jgi:NADH-quinone oxidoreductase subunit G
VLRVLGNMLGLQGFDFETSDDVRTEALKGDIASRLSNRTSATVAAGDAGSTQDLERVANVAIYGTDSLVRSATSLQLTADAKAPAVGLSRAVWSRLGLSDGAMVRVAQGDAQAVLPAALDTTLADNAVRVAAGRHETAALGAMFGPISVAKA